MAYRFDRSANGSRCPVCPLNRKRRCWGISEIPDFRIAIYGEAPGIEEDRAGKPFVGPAGKLLSHACVQASIQRRNTWVSNVLPCLPTGPFDSAEVEEALECCKFGLKAELDWVLKRAWVVVAMGDKPLRYVLGEWGSGITKVRGSVFPLKGGAVGIPTFHPAYILRGARKELVVMIADLDKARELSLKRWEPPRERFQLRPTLGDLEALRDKAKGSLWGCDIEATGLNPDSSRIIMVGIATSPEDAVVVPFWSQGRKPYWEPKDEPVARKLLRDTLKRAKLVFANASYDLPILRKDLDEPKITAHDDVILMHHAVHPELPHNLSYITLLYGKTPYWKGEVSGRTVALLQLPDETTRTYCARDATATLQVRDGLLEDLRIQGTYDLYRNISMELIEPTLEMTMTGLPLSQKRLRTWKGQLRKQLDELERKMHTDYGLPGSFNINSDQHMDLLFHGEVAGQFQRAVEWLKTAPKRTNTKKYRKAKELADLVAQVKPMRLPDGYRQLKTDSGRWSYAQLPMVKLSIAISNRLALLENLVRPTEAHHREAEELRRTHSFIALQREWSRVEKLYSTYTDFPVWSDGRVHPKYKIIGTRTGRLASGGATELVTDDDRLNIQNQPEEARKLFVAPDGWRFISADYSNLELRILAAVSHDDVLQDIFDKGLNVHDVLTRQLFDVEPDHPQWKVLRRAEKTIIFGFSYGGGLQTLLDNVTVKVPEAGLTMARLRSVLENYAKTHPAYFRWREQLLRDLFTRSPPRLQNAFGRVRLFLGSKDDIEKEALDFPMQSNAADIANRALIGFYKWRCKERLQTRIVCQVHDSIVLLAPSSEVRVACSSLRRIMEEPVQIEGRSCVFPVDLSLGKSWGELEELPRGQSA